MKILLKMITLALIATASLQSCKSRKVAISNSDSITQNSLHSLDQQTFHFMDTGHVDYDKITSLTTHDIFNSSTGTKTTITPVPGTESTVDPDGTFHGQAQSIETTRHDSTQQEINTTNLLQESKSEIKGIDSSGSSLHQSDQQQKTQVTKSGKTVDAEADHGYIWVILGIVAMVLFALYMWYRSTVKTVATGIDVADKIVS